MASIINQSGGFKQIAVVCPDQVRRRIRLGKASQRNAEAVKVHIENIAAAIRTGAPLEHATEEWLMKIDDRFHQRLVKLGLTDPRKTTNAQLEAFCNEYIDAKPVKQNTVENLRQVRDWLVEHFGATRNLRNVTAADAERWRDFLRMNLSENTIRRHIGRARQFWKHAIRRGLAKSNPFEGMSASVRSDKSRQHFIDRATTAKIIDACPNNEWRLIVALARYGGLRVPSETNRMQWSFVDWDRSRIRVESPKTEHIEGKAERFIPLFPELRPYLLAAFDEAPAGERYVIRRHRGENLRTHLLRILKKASVDAWPKPFHNLRASRETELTETYPLHVVCAWIGNSPRVAHEHYLMVHDAFFDSASGQKDHKAAQQMSADNRDVRKAAGDGSDLHGVATGCDALQRNEYPRQGPKYPQKSIETQDISRSGGAPSGAHVARRAERLRHPSVRRATHKIRAALAAGVRKGRAR
jgi:site-specific recombinase XerD